MWYNIIQFNASVFSKEGAFFDQYRQTGTPTSLPYVHEPVFYTDEWYRQHAGTAHTTIIL